MPTPSDNVAAFDYDEIIRALEDCSNDIELFKQIVNAPFKYHVQTVLLFLGIVVLLQVNKATGMIDRVALSDTDLAHSTTRVSTVPFKEIKIGIDHSHNIIAKAIRSGKPQHTSDWEYLFTPAMSGGDARINQASAGIASSTVYPLKSRDGGALIFSYFQYPQYIGSLQKEFMQRYSALVDGILG